jgi:nitrilase
MKITAIQMNSINDKQANLDAAVSLAEAAILDDKPDLIAFPEMMAFYGGTVQDRKNSAEDIPDGQTTDTLATLAKKHGVFIHGGSFYEKAGNKVYNTTVAFDREGEIIATYRKIHLFDITAPDGEDYKESDTVVPGTDVITYQADEITVGCSICYDLRFAELYLKLAKAGADLIMIPAAFTLQTGKDHWETLIKARAIETQCYTMAPAQSGSYPDGMGGMRETWGHSMIVDPWGLVVARTSYGTGWASATMDTSYLTKIRSDVPVANHRVLRK